MRVCLIFSLNLKSNHNDNPVSSEDTSLCFTLCIGSENWFYFLKVKTDIYIGLYSRIHEIEPNRKKNLYIYLYIIIQYKNTYIASTVTQYLATRDFNHFDTSKENIQKLLNGGSVDIPDLTKVKRCLRVHF